jgi:hypothetical protein
MFLGATGIQFAVRRLRIRTIMIGSAAATMAVLPLAAGRG